MTAGTSAMAAIVSAREVLRVRSREPDPVDSCVCDGVQYLGEAFLAVEVATVAVDVLTKERDLTYPVRHQAPHLSLDLCDGPRHLTSAHIGNDAVRAEVVASNGDGNPCVPWVLPLRGQVAGEPTRRAASTST